MEADGRGLHYVLTRSEILEKMMKVINLISEVFLLPKAYAVVILIHLRWNSFQASDRLGDDKKKFLSELGLDLVPIKSNSCFSSAEDENNAIDSFMESESIKWCPAPYCCYAIERGENVDDDDDESNRFGVVCLCGYILCWSCMRESHRPVTCTNASIWFDYVLDQSKSVAWIARNAKRCPNCSSAVQREEDSVFRLITCICSYTFCWTCLRSKEEHKGDWNCTEVSAQPPKNQEKASSSSSHLSLWEASDKEMEEAKVGLKNIEENVIPKLSVDFGLSDQDIRAVRESWMLIVQCRQVLKWSYAFGYFLSKYQSEKMDYLNYSREIATKALVMFKESLHKLTEEAKSSGEFTCFDQKLSANTKDIGNTFHEFVKNLEADISEVKVDEPISHWHCDWCTYKNDCVHKKCTMCCFTPPPPHVAFYDNYNNASSSSASGPNMPKNP